VALRTRFSDGIAFFKSALNIRVSTVQSQAITPKFSFFAMFGAGRRVLLNPVMLAVLRQAQRHKAPRG
jgi:hypothetical protein